MRFASLVDLLAVDLNDAAAGHEHLVWSASQLQAYLEEGVNIAFAERPDLFMETIILKVEACQNVIEACDCTKIRRVIGQVTEDGRLIRTLTRRKDNETVRWSGRTCSTSPKNFQLSQYYIDNTSNKIWVWPSVPGGVDVYISVECTMLPDALDDDYEIPAEISAALVQWALYRAKMIDAEYSPTLYQMAITHQETFWAILRAHKTGEKVDDEETTNVTNSRLQSRV